jgi:hypothetical protein
LSGSPTAHGTILRYSLAGAANPIPCSSLTPSGLDKNITLLAWIPGATPLIATVGLDKGLQIFDPAIQVIVAGNNFQTLNPAPVIPIMEVVPLQDTSGNQLVAVGSDDPISIVHAFKASDGSFVRKFFTNSDLLLSINHSMTAALNPMHLFATNLSTSAYAEVDVNPWVPANTNVIPDSTPDTLVTIYSITVGTTRRTAWTGYNEGGAGVYTGVYFRDYPTSSGSAASPAGPIDPSACVPGVVKCDLTYVVPDPTLSGQFLGICGEHGSGSPEANHLIQFSGTTCTPFLDGNTLTSTYIRRLAIAQ